MNICLCEGLFISYVCNLLNLKNMKNVSLILTMKNDRWVKILLDVMFGMYDYHHEVVFVRHKEITENYEIFIEKKWSYSIRMVVKYLQIKHALKSQLECSPPFNFLWKTYKNKLQNI